MARTYEQFRLDFGTAMQITVETVRELNPTAGLIRVPAKSPGVIHHLSRQVDRLDCLLQATHFSARGQTYLVVHTTSDAEVIAALPANRDEPR